MHRGKGYPRQKVLEGFLGGLGDGIIMTDMQERIVYCNEAAQEILEWPSLPVLGTSFSTCCPLLDVHSGLPYRSPVAEALATGRSVGLARNIGVLGTQGPIYLSMTCAPMLSPGGRPIGCFVIVRDVTHMRALEMKIEEDQRYMRSVFSAATVGFCLLNVRGAIVDINEAALETMQADYDAVMGQQFGDAFLCANSLEAGCGHGHMCGRCPARRNIEAAIGDDSFTSEFEVVMRSRRSVEAVWLKVFVSQMGVGEEKQVILALVNESARRQYERQLEAAKTAAEEAGRTKMRFLSNMSHEIRTPINGVLGMLKLALKQPLPPRQQEYLENARQSSEDLLRLINDILDFSKLESGHMKLEDIAFDLHALLKQVGDTYRPLARAQGLGVELPETAGLPQFVRGDPLRLRQIFNNLLTNALKFTSQGKISLKAASGERSGKRVLEFAVRDTGIGMTEAEMGRIFRPFTQADPSTTRRYGGTGLGLMIVKELLTSMGGDIEVKSWPGRGSRFSFYLPLREAAGAEPELREASVFLNPKLVGEKMPAQENKWLRETLDGAASISGANDDISDLLAYASQKLGQPPGKDDEE